MPSFWPQASRRAWGVQSKLLPLDGTNVAGSRSIRNVCSAGLAEIVLVLGASAESFAGSSPQALGGLKVVVNQAYAQGMASSLRELDFSPVDAQSPAALIILGDQPLVRPQTLHQIMADHRSGARL